LLTSKAKSFPTKTNKEKAPVNSQAWFQREAKSFWFASAQITDSSGKKILDQASAIRNNTKLAQVGAGGCDCNPEPCQSPS